MCSHEKLRVYNKYIYIIIGKCTKYFPFPTFELSKLRLSWELLLKSQTPSKNIKFMSIIFDNKIIFFQDHTNGIKSQVN